MPVAMAMLAVEGIGGSLILTVDCLGCYGFGAMELALCIIRMEKIEESAQG